MGELDPSSGIAARFAPRTVEHFQNPRNVGRIERPDAVVRLDDRETDTTITLYAVLDDRARTVQTCRFRTFGCSACIAACSVATEWLTGREPTALLALDAAWLDAALGGLPADKRYCAELAAAAVRGLAAELARRD
ncbi:MAG: iron-sulfur cluster assembly scaffold protein [Chloroflexi bacterium]|nr:iron-sulfur cluster assembly scaffold protein [Chloroflexota bacterium]